MSDALPAVEDLFLSGPVLEFPHGAVVFLGVDTLDLGQPMAGRGPQPRQSVFETGIPTVPNSNRAYQFGLWCNRSRAAPSLGEQ